VTFARPRSLILRAAGYAVIRYTWQQITRQGDQVAADVSRALAVRDVRCTPEPFGRNAR